MTTKMNLNNTTEYSHMYPDHKNYQAWLIVDETPVAFLHLLGKKEYEGALCVCSVEVREGHERKGYAKKLMSMAAEELGQTLATNGSFTPEGFAALNGKLPLLPKHVAPEKPKFESMTFVRDWDEMRKF